MNTNIDVKMKPKTFFIATYGCQMNEEDSEKLSGMLKRSGYTRIEEREAAALYYLILVVLERMRKIRFMVTLEL